jgi:hypothetical protein
MAISPVELACAGKFSCGLRPYYGDRVRATGDGLAVQGAGCAGTTIILLRCITDAPRVSHSCGFTIGTRQPPPRRALRGEWCLRLGADTQTILVAVLLARPSLHCEV